MHYKFSIKDYHKYVGERERDYKDCSLGSVKNLSNN